MTKTLGWNIILSQRKEAAQVSKSKKNERSLTTAFSYSFTSGRRGEEGGSVHTCSDSDASQQWSLVWGHQWCEGGGAVYTCSDSDASHHLYEGGMGQSMLTIDNDTSHQWCKGYAYRCEMPSVMCLIHARCLENISKVICGNKIFLWTVFTV